MVAGKEQYGDECVYVYVFVCEIESESMNLFCVFFVYKYWMCECVCSVYVLLKYYLNSGFDLELFLERIVFLFEF